MIERPKIERMLQAELRIWLLRTMDCLKGQCGGEAEAFTKMRNNMSMLLVLYNEGTQPEDVWIELVN